VEVDPLGYDHKWKWQASTIVHIATGCGSTSVQELHIC
jgi:hypothetical protein